MLVLTKQGDTLCSQVGLGDARDSPQISGGRLINLEGKLFQEIKGCLSQLHGPQAALD